MTFLTYNILDGGRGREAELLDIIAAQNADVVLLQEVLDTAFVERAAARGGYHVFVAESNSGIRIALLTRLRIQDATSFHPPVLRHTCLEATLEYAPNKTLQLIAVHLAAPAFTLPVELYRLRELNVIFKHMAARAERIVIAGDFNSIAPGDTLEFGGLPRRLRLSVFLQGGYWARQVIGKMRAEGFTDVYRALNPGGKGCTFPAAHPDTRLDYIFVNEGLRPMMRACAVVTAPESVRRASDHLPVWMELEL